MEPEIPMLAEFLNRAGAKISGAGTPTIVVEGVEKIGGGKFTLIPDRIETGTFVILGALAGGEIRVTNCVPENVEALLVLLERAGADFSCTRDEIVVRGGKKLKAVNLMTHEYPGFATDLQPPFTLLLTQAEGISLVHDPIFDGRLVFTDILNTMGARIIMNDPHRVLVSGPTKLHGRKIASPDLRAGISLLMAGLIAHGTTVIDNIYQIDRGYEKIEERLNALGAQIKRI
jgi:UDP-N-acetylglucosamine 1-carboxyvinyltransferase